MDKLIGLLHEGGYSCVVSKGGECRTFTKPGIMDLYELIENDPEFLHGASVADKVVGKAAATLMIRGGVARMYADVISEPAIALLRNSTVESGFGQSVPFIENRDKSGICPLENACMHTGSLEELFILIKGFVSKICHR
ncbi:MAG: DUF1893 domain-containing protein [Tannerellaceae bacterium]|jgi:iron complex outermembrane receptor protein/vitamin B12 transporter|nr:DUF1893 domain-containing protein [Tannerellaceae bacterium]